MHITQTIPTTDPPELLKIHFPPLTSVLGGGVPIASLFITIRGIEKYIENYMDNLISLGDNPHNSGAFSAM